MFVVIVCTIIEKYIVVNDSHLEHYFGQYEAYHFLLLWDDLVY